MTISKSIIMLIVCFSILFVTACDSKDSNTKVNNSKEKTASLLVSQKICPVMGGEIDKTIAPVVKNGKKIYMCCEHCRKEMTDNFEENVQKLKKIGQKPEDI